MVIKEAGNLGRAEHAGPMAYMKVSGFYYKVIGSPEVF